MVKVVKVKMVIFIFGLCHLLTIYKYRIFIYSGESWQLKIILTKWPNDHNDRKLLFYPSPMWYPCKSLPNPIFLPFLGTDLQRFYNGITTDLLRRHILKEKAKKLAFEKEKGSGFISECNYELLITNYLISTYRASIR